MAMFLLNSCGDRAAQSHIDFGIDDGDLVLANCGGSLSDLESILVTEFDGKRNNYVLDAKDGPTFPRGATLVIDGSLWGSVAEARTASLAPGNRVDVLLVSPEGTDAATFSIPDEGLQEGVWLSSSGETVAEPCGS